MCWNLQRNLEYLLAWVASAGIPPSHGPMTEPHLQCRGLAYKRGLSACLTDNTHLVCKSSCLWRYFILGKWNFCIALVVFPYYRCFSTMCWSRSCDREDIHRSFGKLLKVNRAYSKFSLSLYLHKFWIMFVLQNGKITRSCPNTLHSDSNNIQNECEKSS